MAPKAPHAPASHRSTHNEAWTSQQVNIRDQWSNGTDPIIPGDSAKPFVVPMCTYNGEPRPLVLHLSAWQRSSLTAFEQYFRQDIGFYAGGQDLTETFYSYRTNVACVVESGFGSARKQWTFDWQPGTYQLPEVEFARVSAMIYGPAPDTEGTYAPKIACSVVPGQCIGKVPTRTQIHNVIAQDSVSLKLSQYTRALELLAETGQDWTLSGPNLYVKRDPSSDTNFPNTSPVPYMPLTADADGTVTLTNNDAAVTYAVVLVEYLDFG